MKTLIRRVFWFLLSPWILSVLLFRIILGWLIDKKATLKSEFKQANDFYDFFGWLK